MLPDGIYHSEKVTGSFRKAYTDPFPTPKSRKPTWIFPRQIWKARRWLADIESKLPVLSDLPAQILWWTHDDPGFPLADMKRWQGYLKMNETETLADASHTVQEDRPDRVVASIRRVLERTGWFTKVELNATKKARLSQTRNYGWKEDLKSSRMLLAGITSSQNTKFGHSTCIHIFRNKNRQPFDISCCCRSLGICWIIVLLWLWTHDPPLTIIVADSLKVRKSTAFQAHLNIGKTIVILPNSNLKI